MSTKLIDSLRGRFKVAPGEHVGIKQSVGKVEIKGDGVTITAIANTAAVDFDDEVVLPEGCERNGDGEPVYFSSTKAILWNHDMYLPPIGTYRNARLDGGKWVCQFAMSTKTDFARDIAALIGEGCVNGTSIGFVRKSGGSPTDKEISLYGVAEFVTREWRWLELSVTPFPCNPEALIVGSKSKLPPEFTEKVVKAAERHVIRSSTVEALGCQLARPKRIVILSGSPLTVNIPSR